MKLRRVKLYFLDLLGSHTTSFLFFFLLLNNIVNAEYIIQRMEQENKEDKKFISINEHSNIPDLPNKQNWLSSNFAKRCEGELSRSWAQAVTPGVGPEVWNSSVSQMQRELAAINEKSDNNYKQKRLDLFAAYHGTIINCEVLRNIYQSFDKEYDSRDTVKLKNKRVSNKSSSSNSYFQCLNSPNKNKCFQEAMAKDAQGVGGMRCISKRAETLDYKQCSKFLSTMDKVILGKRTIQEFQEKNAIRNAQNDQAELGRKRSKGEAITIKDALSMQKNGLDDQARIAKQRTVMESGITALMMVMYRKMPTKEKIYKACSSDEFDTTKNIDQINMIMEEAFKNSVKLPKTSFDIIVANNFGEGIEVLCDDVMQATGNSMIMNEEAYEQMTQMMITSGIAAAANMLKYNKLKKSAGNLDGIMVDMETLEKPEYGEVYRPQIISLCQTNPQDPRCKGVQGGRSNMGPNGNNLTINPTGTNFRSSGARSSNEEISKNGAQDINIPTSSFGSSDGEFGDPIAQSTADNSIVGQGSAGSYKNLGHNSAGGGGGNSGGSGGSGSGGSIPQATANNTGGKRSQGIDVKLTKKKNIAGGLGFRSGGIKSSRRPSSNKNPFSSLFGKKGKRRSKSTELRFRKNLIPQNKSIWEQINRAYGSSYKNNRLLINN